MAAAAEEEKGKSKKEEREKERESDSLKTEFVYVCSVRGESDIFTVTEPGPLGAEIIHRGDVLAMCQTHTVWNCVYCETDIKDRRARTAGRRWAADERGREVRYFIYIYTCIRQKRIFLFLILKLSFVYTYIHTHTHTDKRKNIYKKATTTLLYVRLQRGTRRENKSTRIYKLNFRVYSNSTA